MFYLAWNSKQTFPLGAILWKFSFIYMQIVVNTESVRKKSIVFSARQPSSMYYELLWRSNLVMVESTCHDILFLR
jgi:hypothetical protein